MIASAIICYILWVQSFDFPFYHKISTYGLHAVANMLENMPKNVCLHILPRKCPQCLWYFFADFCFAGTN
jgi:hypothetical protein